MRYLFALVCAFSALVCAFTMFGQNYKVQTGTGIAEMAPEVYVAGVAAGESGEFKSDEALKAMAVAARTYAARMRGRHEKEGFDFCSTTHCQRFVAASSRTTKAAWETQGQILWYQRKPAFSVYSQNCGGRTENVHAVWPDVDAPYLISQDDPYCSRGWVWSGSVEKIGRALKLSGLTVPAQLRNITVVRRTDSGRAQLLSLDGELISASTFRFAMGRVLGWNTVRSEQYSVENTGGRILFRGSGDGHGVGLCQAGADVMGQHGKSYREILEFYYPGTTVSVNARAFHWTQLGGEGVVLYTMLPDSDRVVIGQAEAVIRRWRGRLPWPLRLPIGIYVYPDLAAFRNATGEPGWVAARTSGSKIEMQPLEVLRSHGVLESTLEHELVHSFVEMAGKPGLEVWFREGLVEYLTSGPTSARGDADEGAIRQRGDREAAELAYQGAQARVQELVKHYGEAAVLSWVTRGLPEAVKYSTASKPAVKSK